MGQRSRYNDYATGLEDRHWVPFSGHRDSFTGVKRPGSDVKHSLTSSSKIKNEGRYTPTPFICLHGVDSEKFIIY